MGEETGNIKIVYIYDDTNSPIGMLYTEGNGSNAGWSAFWFEKNLQGDIVAVYDQNGNKSVSYTYDAWGNFTTTYHNGASSSSIAAKNPFRYRGYYYDADLGLYYVSSRYYDSIIGRWINADNVIAGVAGEILGYNLFAYCMNNPVNMSDPTGNRPKWIEKAANWVNKNIIQPVKNFFSPSSAVADTANSLPPTGKPGSSQTLPNPDGTPKQKRWYGQDGNAVRDRDYNHPGKDISFPHDHEWKNGQRQEDHLPPSPDYEFSLDPVLGVGLVTICVIGIVVVAANDATGIGVADDFLFGPLGAGVGEGLILIFG